jgi:hypothetical protein
MIRWPGNYPTGPGSAFEMADGAEDVKFIGGAEGYVTLADA